MNAKRETAIVRLLKIVEKLGVGWLAPWQTRRVGRAQIDVKREMRLALAQAEGDVKEIESGRKRLVEGRLVDAEEGRGEAGASHGVAAPSLASAAARNLAADRMRGEVNVAKTLLLAEAALDDGDGDQPSPDGEVDDDWLYRWRDSASTVSNEELQEMWGRVLAGEVKAPGTFSLRTLEFMKNLSQSEAALISKLARLVFDGGFIVVDHQSDIRSLDPYGITFSDTVRLQELGVITPIAMVKRAPIQIAGAGHGLVAHNRMLVIKPGPQGESTLDLPNHMLTPVGRQVLKLGSFEADEAYLRWVGEMIKAHGFKVYLADYAPPRAMGGKIVTLGLAMEEL